MPVYPINNHLKYKYSHMKSSIFRPILGGIVFGAFIFFTGPLILVVLLLKFIFTPFGMGRMRFGRFGGPWGHHMAFAGGGMMPGPGSGFADKIRGMSEEEYGQFKQKMKGRFQGCGWYHEKEEKSTEQ
jgi:hypothetical protein